MPANDRTFAARLGVAAIFVGAVVVAGRASTADAGVCSFKSVHSVSRVTTTAKLVALTFDDGPVNLVTAKILAVLKEKNVKATFFPVGKLIERRPELAKQEVEEGHEVGNHSWSHPAYNPKKVIGELDKSTKKIQEATGLTPTLFRPPYSCLNKALDKAAWQRGMTPIQFTTQSWDSRSPSPSPKNICKNALKGAKPGVIVVFHDKKNTAAALPCVIDGFRAKGFEMVTVSELLTHAGQ